MLAKSTLQLESLLLAEEYSSFALFMAAVGGVVVAEGEFGDGFVLLHGVVVVFDVFFDFFVQIDAFGFHGAGGIGVQEAGRAGGVGDIGDAWRRAVRAGLLLLLVGAETCEEELRLGRHRERSSKESDKR